MESKPDKWVCAHCGYTAAGRFKGDICPGCGLTYWKGFQRCHLLYPGMRWAGFREH